MVVAVLSALAYAFVESNYRSIVAPALDTPEGRAGLAAAMRPALLAILSGDALLLIVVGLAAYALARAALRPLAAAREREERFTADVAHELRTPLGAIASVAQAAVHATEEEARTALATIARRAIESGELVSDLLTLARASDIDALEREPVDLALVAQAIVRDIPSSETTLSVEGSFGSAIVAGDERRLRQLVRNLVDNARRHARTRVTVSVEAMAGNARLCVDDDGPGVSPEVVPRLFERFSRGSASQGSGLGLAICRWVARAHGGDLFYDGGARFIVLLPLGRFS